MVQSSYIPWKGYFDIIRRADEFILFDDAQYTRRDWRNRNRVKTASGPQWLSISVDSKGRYSAPIKDITVSDPGWCRQHWDVLVHNYSRARFFKDYRVRFEELYRGASEARLSAINRRFIDAICQVLGIRTKISWSMDYELRPGRSERIIGLCLQAGASEYLSGPTARAYLDEAAFQRDGIKVSYMDYSGYPDYTQLYPPFTHAVTILDLIFNEGPRALNFMQRL